MKNQFLPLLTGAILLTGGQYAAGQCWLYEKDQVFGSKTESWVNTAALQPTWVKLKDTKKDEEIINFNKAILDGRKGDYGGTVDYRVTALTTDGKMQGVRLKALSDAFTYETTNYCDGDTFYLIRNEYPVYSVLNGDTLGMGLQGVQKIPAKLNVGDVLPPYYDYSLTIPRTWKTDIKEKVFSFSYTTTQSGGYGFGQDRSGNYGWGTIETKVRHDVYDLISHEVTITEQLKNVTIHYAVSSVTGTEELTLGSKKVTAYVIESQDWTKVTLDRDYQAEKTAVAEQAQAEYIKLMDKAKKQEAKRFPKNALGYDVVYKREWFVPGYGVVKFEMYDATGAIKGLNQTVFK